MLQYDEKDICKKCGKKLKSHIVNYDYYHDYSHSVESYKKVDRSFAKKVGLDFYCNDCYENIGDNSVDDIIEIAENFLGHDLFMGAMQVEKIYKQKIKELNEIKQYIENCISFLKNKNKLSDLTKEEMELLLKTNYVYMPAYQDIKVGFCRFEQYSEVKELYNKIKDS